MSLCIFHNFVFKFKLRLCLSMIHTTKCVRYVNVMNRVHPKSDVTLKLFFLFSLCCCVSHEARISEKPNKKKHQILSNRSSRVEDTDKKIGRTKQRKHQIVSNNSKRVDEIKLKRKRIELSQR